MNTTERVLVKRGVSVIVPRITSGEIRPIFRPHRAEPILWIRKQWIATGIILHWYFIGCDADDFAQQNQKSKTIVANVFISIKKTANGRQFTQLHIYKTSEEATRELQHCKGQKDEADINIIGTKHFLHFQPLTKKFNWVEELAEIGAVAI